MACHIFWLSSVRGVKSETQPTACETEREEGQECRHFDGRKTGYADRSWATKII